MGTVIAVGLSVMGNVTKKWFHHIPVRFHWINGSTCQEVVSVQVLCVEEQDVKKDV
jgi:hypothetical protein